MPAKRASRLRRLQLTFIPVVLGLTVYMIQEALPQANSQPINPAKGVRARPPRPSKTGDVDTSRAASRKSAFLTEFAFDPARAKYFDLVNRELALRSDESALLKQNGFVVSDRLAFKDFTTGYAYIYWKDLPVLVTTDSILHAIHQTYDDLLMHLEETILTAKLKTLLSRSRQQLQSDAQEVSDHALRKIYVDLDAYLTVPLALLEGPKASISTTADAALYLQRARAADNVIEVELFGGERKVDFTLFKPRGHYTKSEPLARYFRAMVWLAQIDFRLVAYDEKGNPHLNLGHVAAAALLHQTIDRAHQRRTWQEIDRLFGTLVGRSDNTTLPDLDRFLADAHTKNAAELLHHPAPDRLLTMLTSGNYGHQRITGQILLMSLGNTKPVPRPVSFMLLGQRFAVDSYVMSNLVYDRLKVDGKLVKRPLPSPLEVMHALGNKRAATHLQSELAWWGHQKNLEALRTEVDQTESSLWNDGVYNRWLGALRTLNTDTTASAYPQVMRTAAWADKVLHTQLASWAQLRHDNILYVKQSFTGSVMCSYPAGYVEPYPQFYAAVRDYAKSGRSLFEGLDVASLTQQGQEFRWRVVQYFSTLGTVAARLQALAEKEMCLLPFTAEEERFLKQIASRRWEAEDNICAMVWQEKWDGWYLELFPWRDKNPALISDVHTNPNTDSNGPLPPAVLHVATGPVAALVFIADTDEGSTVYVGPAFTYFEVVEEGFPPVRLTDKAWDKRLNTGPRPSPPGWTASFRLAVTQPPALLSLPDKPATPPKRERGRAPRALPSDVPVRMTEPTPR